MKNNPFPARRSLGSRTGSTGIAFPNAALKSLDDMRHANQRAEEMRKRNQKNVETMNQQADEARKRMRRLQNRNRTATPGSDLRPLFLLLIVAVYFALGRIPSSEVRTWLHRHDVPARVSDELDSALHLR